MVGGPPKSPLHVEIKKRIVKKQEIIAKTKRKVN